MSSIARKHFEAWYRESHRCCLADFEIDDRLKLDPNADDETYLHIGVESNWLVWKAAIRSSIASEADSDDE
jgi:hypothetical protein